MFSHWIKNYRESLQRGLSDSALTNVDFPCNNKSGLATKPTKDANMTSWSLSEKKPTKAELCLAVTS